MKKPTPSDANPSPPAGEAAAPAAPAWAITLAGTAYQLRPSVPALRAIERQTGATILMLVEAGANGALSIDQLTSIAVCMVDAPDDDRLFARSHVMAAGQSPLSAKGGGAGALADGVAAAIVEHGLTGATARLILPLAAAMSGLTTAAGIPKSREG